MTCSIQGVELQPEHAGAIVEYVDDNASFRQLGVLSSWRLNDDGTTAIYVRFNGPQGELCPAECLRWGRTPIETFPKPAPGVAP